MNRQAGSQNFFERGFTAEHCAQWGAAVGLEADEDFVWVFAEPRMHSSMLLSTKARRQLGPCKPCNSTVLDGVCLSLPSRWDMLLCSNLLCW